MRIKYFTSGLIVATLLFRLMFDSKNIAYFPELNTGSIVQAENMLEIKVKPEDKLSVIVSTQDPSLSNMFNLVTTQNRLGQTTSSTTTVGGASSNGSGQASLYMVDSHGDINFPYIGETSY